MLYLKDENPYYHSCKKKKDEMQDEIMYVILFYYCNIHMILIKKIGILIMF